MFELWQQGHVTALCCAGNSAAFARASAQAVQKQVRPGDCRAICRQQPSGFSMRGDYAACRSKWAVLQQCAAVSSSFQHMQRSIMLFLGRVGRKQPLPTLALPRPPTPPCLPACFPRCVVQGASATAVASAMSTGSGGTVSPQDLSSGAGLAAASAVEQGVKSEPGGGGGVD